MNAFTRKIDSMVELSNEKRRVLAKLTEHAQLLEPRERIIEEPPLVSIVMRGWACRYKILPDGQRQITALLLPGDMCDPYGFLMRTTDHNVQTLTPVTLAKVPGDTIRDLMASGPELAEALGLQMLEAVEIQREWTVSLGKRNAIERVAHLCCEIATRLEALGQTDGVNYNMALTQVELADVVGLSHVQVNRSLGELRARGLIEFRNRRLTIVNRQALMHLAMFDPAYLQRRLTWGLVPPATHLSIRPREQVPQRSPR